MSYSTVIFDLDGTLIDTVPLIVASHRHALATVLGRELPEEALREGIGRPLLEQMRVFDEQRAQELFDVYREFNHRVHDDYVTVFPGMLELCDDLRARGVPVAVATSKMLDAVLLAYGVIPGLEERIDAMVTIESTATHKPGPEPIEHALDAARPPEGGRRLRRRRGQRPAGGTGRRCRGRRRHVGRVRLRRPGRRATGCDRHDTCRARRHPLRRWLATAHGILPSAPPGCAPS